jgi:excisionase family DNA binding protein
MQDRQIVSQRYMDTEALAKELGVSRHRIWSMVRSGEIPHLRFGRQIRFDREKIESWIARHSSYGSRS